MTNVLFLVHRIPFPPDKGDKIRSYHLLKYLSKESRVYLGAFVDSANDWKFKNEINRLCEEVYLRPIGGWRSWPGAFWALFRRKSLSIGYYRDKKMKQWIAGLLKQHDFNAIVAYSSTMAQYIPDELPDSVRKIADFVDVDSDKWRQYAAESGWFSAMLYRYEANALARWESAVLDSVDAVTLVSQAECNFVGESDRAKVHVVRNGVDLEYFDPTFECDSPYRKDTKIVVFTGAMDYYANEDGVRWFAENVWLDILNSVASAEFWIVGSNPTEVVRSLARINGITVTGRVPDVRPFLRYATAAVAPLRLARGVQNKVLEALAMNLPVIAAPQALQGIDDSWPEEIIEANSSEDFVRAVSDLLVQDKSDCRCKGRDYVRDNYDWNKNLSGFRNLISKGDTGLCTQHKKWQEAE